MNELQFAKCALFQLRFTFQIMAHHTDRTQINIPDLEGGSLVGSSQYLGISMSFVSVILTSV